MKGVVKTLKFRNLSNATGQFHPAAQSGFSKENIDRYEIGRPQYSSEALAFIVQLLNEKYLSSSSSSSSSLKNSPYSLLEIGAGTGKFTTSFFQTSAQSPYSWLQNCQYLALEPSDFIEKLSSLNLPIQVQKGVAENIPSKDQTMDGVMIAQAFHWMSNQTSLSEIHRVLKKDCPLILIWNGYDDRVDWIKQFQKQIILPRYPAGTPTYQSGEWEHVFHTPLGQKLFHPLQKFTCSNSIQGNLSMVVNRALSTSVISNQNNETRQEVEREILELISSHPETRMIPKDSPDGFIMKYQTLVAYTYAKKE